MVTSNPQMVVVVAEAEVTLVAVYLLILLCVLIQLLQTDQIYLIQLAVMVTRVLLIVMHDMCKMVIVVSLPKHYEPVPALAHGPTLPPAVPPMTTVPTL